MTRTRNTSPICFNSSTTPSGTSESTSIIVYAYFPLLLFVRSAMFILSLARIADIWTDHIRHIVMQYQNTRLIASQSHITVRIVHGMFDITIFQIIHHFFDCHLRTIIFGLFCRSSEMRNYNRAFDTCDFRCREVCDIMFYFFQLQVHLPLPRNLPVHPLQSSARSLLLS